MPPVVVTACLLLVSARLAARQWRLYEARGCESSVLVVVAGLAGAIVARALAAFTPVDREAS